MQFWHKTTLRTKITILHAVRCDLYRQLHRQFFIVTYQYHSSVVCVSVNSDLCLMGSPLLLVHDSPRLLAMYVVPQARGLDQQGRVQASTQRCAGAYAFILEHCANKFSAALECCTDYEVREPSVRFAVVG